MYDFWFTLGYSAMDTGLPKKVMPAQGKTKFNFVDRVVVEADAQGNITTRQGPSTGLLDKTSTTTMRTDIVKYFVTANVAAPPIGIYTAGRFCQLVSIPLFDSKTPNTSFLDIMKKANAAYINATTTGKSNLPAFPAILGLTMMDSFLTDAIRKPDTGTAVVSPADLVEILGEFGVKIPSGDFTILQNFVNDQGFKDAVGLLMGGAGPEDPWADAGTTLEQMVFWTGKTEYAIP